LLRLLGSTEQDAAFSLCERALLLDERNVDALSILAFKYAVRPANLLSTDPQADIRQAQELVSRVLAIELDNYRVTRLSMFSSAIPAKTNRPQKPSRQYCSLLA
jgi:hypothetical protein